MKKRILTIAIAVMSAAVSAGAQNEAFGWMCQENDPVASAMAGASLASSSNIVYSAFHNPAAIPFAPDRLGAGASYSMTGNGYGLVGAGAGFKVGKRVGLTVAGNYNKGAEYDVFDEYGNRNGSFKTSSMLFSAGLGIKVIDMLSVGANFKYAVERLQPDDNPGAFAADVYAMFKWNVLAVSAGVSNLGTDVRDLGGNKFSLPSSGHVAVNYAQDVAAKHYVEAEIDADCYFSGRFAMALGAQYGFNDMVFVRAGYRYGGKSVIPSYASAGLGVKFFGVHLDASYLFASEVLKNAFSVGLSYTF
ncbi:MAG: PorV/PorQ family protein [Bacteroidales bacterium]|nr:PorV/PorQ family protein [Bacteroidales bacterium]